ncbi:helix-turn-helix transcriptional regulator [Liquorilactobacillus capillatus]|uniref:Transcriptional regulator n=2 Tax=Liquorilactobacillus capillatus TaxID=480931 RepID=A0A0R1LZ33_9LACO|nr:helix-turn-helix transcriptional regulator [Liquorilactobacillus capillatus]AJA33844.1 transcriptional regulator [Liquorilactobacillus capillatus]KRL00800.1 transcriptional regulator [Liquorilactobacillus capillatus DSM 19910]
MELLFPNQLKKYRKKAQMSQEDLATKLHISRQAISRWEAGDATPDLSNLIKLAELFNCSLDNLVLGLEQPDNSTEKIDPNEFIFDPRDGKYIRRHHPLNFWEFLVKYWWLIFVIGGWLSWFIPEIVDAFR